MNTISLIVSVALTSMAFGTQTYSQNVTTQSAEEPQCSGPVYGHNEVSVKARITSKPLPDYPEEARLNNISGRVVLTAVLCRSGKVTDIRVLKGLPHGVTEACIEATRRIEFEAGEKGGEKASIRLRVEHDFNLL